MKTRHPVSIELTREDDWWVARDQASGIASQGETREKALQNLDEAVEAARSVQDQEGDAAVPDAPWLDD